MLQWVLTFLSSVLVPIAVALISSGKVAEKVTKKMQIENLFAMLNELKYTVACNHANDCRARILSFNNEIKRKIRHDEEEFNDVLKAIDDYEKFCRNNPDYPNNKAVFAIENIKNTYKETLRDNDFLV